MKTHVNVQAVLFFRLLCFVVAVFACHSSVVAANVPAGFTESRVTNQLSSPTAMAMAPDGRIFICEQGGKVRIVKKDVLLTQPFLTLTVNSTGEKGLLGIAFDPSFSNNKYVYLYYTTNSPATHNRISRFTANGDVAVAGSEKVILELDNIVNFSHHAGAMHFGSDKKLYVAVGDNVDSLNSQSLQNLFGKILRINKDGTIPSDNPFYNATSGKNRAIWALGLRNPFTFAIQPGTGKMFINDVGQDTWEEINQGAKGANYGWPNAEGAVSCSAYQCPFFTYAHGSGESAGCAITGGVFYNPNTQQFPAEYAGDYFFSDYCNGWIRRLDVATKQAVTFATGIERPVDLKVSSAGSLYYLARGVSGVGLMYKVRYIGTLAPKISAHPESQTVSLGQNATFSVTATGGEPLSYQWQRNGVDIPGAASSAYTLGSAQISDDGASFRCVVQNSYGSATSNSAQLNVTSNNLPAGNIMTPVAGTIYSCGDTIDYSGEATDAEDGNLPASAFTWRIDFHHKDHSHPFMPETTGSKTGSFFIPTTGEESSDVWYRIYLTVRDSGEMTHQSYRDVLPRKVNVTLATNPSGLQVKLDGVTLTTPHTFVGVAGFIRKIDALSPQTLNGSSWQWSNWSDSGAQIHNIATPAVDSTITATYTAQTPTITNGLTATYYDNADFSGATVTRIDPQVNFNWADAAPVPGIAADSFSVRWTGAVVPAYTETYTFYTNSNDGARLWVNGQLLIDRWILRAGEHSATLALTAGQKYSIRLEYFEDRYYANIRLAWSSQRQSKQTIPQSKLFSQ